MPRYEVTTLAEAAKEVERMLNIICGHYIEWSNLESECSAFTSLPRVKSVEEFHSRLAVLFRIMDHHIERISHNLNYQLLNTIGSIEFKFPMTIAGTAAVQSRTYPTLGAIGQYWNAKKCSARIVTDMAKEVLPEIPANRALVEQLDKTMPGYQHQHEQFLMWDNAPVETWGNAEFKREFKEQMEDVRALMQGRAPRG